MGKTFRAIGSNGGTTVQIPPEIGLKDIAMDKTLSIKNLPSLSQKYKKVIYSEKKQIFVSFVNNMIIP